MTATRRQRLRAETTATIKAAARDQIRTVGAGQLSLRALAAQIEMSPAGLYRYYASREDLLSAIITDTFTELAEAVRVARDGVDPADHGERLLAAARAYRRWALEHPAEFGLVYGNPLPDYAAPANDGSLEAARAVGAVFYAELGAAWRSGQLSGLSEDQADPDLQASLADFVATAAPDLPPPLASAIHGAWGLMHGLVSLEVFHHLPWLRPDGEALFTTEMRRALRGLGLPV